MNPDACNVRVLVEPRASLPARAKAVLRRPADPLAVVIQRQREAIERALECVRQGSPHEATRILEAAL